MRILRDQAIALSMMTAVVEGSRQDARFIDTSKQLQTFKAQLVEGQQGTGAAKAIHQMHHPEIDAEIREFQKMLDNADAVRDQV